MPDVGADVSDALGVAKFEAVLPDATEIAGPFPALVPKTDEIRLQSALGVLEEIRGHEFVVTTKLDGTSTTFFRDEDGELVVCSRNWALEKGDSAPFRIAERDQLAERIPRGFALQGELCGPGIQKNRLGLSQVEWFVFDVYDVRQGRHLDHAERLRFAHERDLRTVPVEAIVEADAAVRFEHTLERWLALATGF